MDKSIGARGRNSRVVLALLVTASALIAAQPALAAGKSRDNAHRCDQLQAQDFNRIGERVMGKMVGSAQADESMDRLMAQMMGPSNERRMHIVMGERFSGCGNPPLPGGYAGMMGAMGMMGGFASRPGGRSAPGPGATFGPGSMMGFDRSRGGNGDDDAPVGWMIAIMVVLVLGAAAAVYFVARTSRRRPDPRQLLAQRFAQGEIDAEEYRRRNQLLGGAR